MELIPQLYGYSISLKSTLGLYTPILPQQVDLIDVEVIISLYATVHGDGGHPPLDHMLIISALEGARDLEKEGLTTKVER